MAETIRRDPDRLARAPEEAAIESWIEETGIYLMIPYGDTTRQTVDIGRRPSIHRRFAVDDVLSSQAEARGA